MLLLDIRHKDEFEEWLTPGSEYTDVYDELKENPNKAAEGLQTLPKDEDVITVCSVGKVSVVIMDMLQEEGYNARTLLARI